MHPENLEQLITEYLANQELHAAVDFGNKSSVKAGNKAADRMRNIAAELREATESTTRFEALLDHPNPMVRKWVAHHLLELMEPSKSAVERSLSIIEQASLGDSAEALGERMWLASWNAAHAT